MKAAGFPHSDISGSRPVDGSPELIAVFRVLLRLPMPRHPSCARIRLARNFFLASRSGPPPSRKASPPRASLLSELQFSSISNHQLSKSKKAHGGDVLAGGGSRIRTGDILLAKQILYQLSYTPERITIRWWARQESNL